MAIPGRAALVFERGEMPESLAGALDVSDMADEGDWIALVPTEMRDMAMPWGEEDADWVWTSFTSTANLRQWPRAIKICAMEDSPNSLQVHVQARRRRSLDRPDSAWLGGCVFAP